MAATVPRMTVFQFADPALGRRFGESRATAVVVAASTKFPRILIPGENPEIVVGETKVSETTSLVFSCGEGEADSKKSGGDASSAGSEQQDSGAYLGANNLVRGFSRETVHFKSAGGVLSSGTKVVMEGHGSGVVSGFMRKDVKYKIMLEGSADGGPTIMHAEPQRVTEIKVKK